MSTTPTPVPAPESEKKGTMLWWFLGLFLGGVVVLSLAGLLVAGYFLRQVQVRDTAGQVEIQSPVGSVKVEKNAPADTGLPVYPGAQTTVLGATVELTAPNDESVHVTAARFRTPDALATVDDWYRARLGPEFTREGPGVMIRKKNIFGIEVKSSDTAFISDANDMLRVVVLERKGLVTEIGLARIGRNETQ